MPTSRLHEIKGVMEDGIFRRMKTAEKLSEAFTFDVEILCENKDISPYSVFGKDMSIAITKTDGAVRYFNGIVADFANVGPLGGYQLYSVQLKPKVWLLSHAKDNRIFQNLSVPQIIEKVVKEKHNISDFRLKLASTYASREYCVQYRETDFDFISRLMEDEGIYYYFEHSVSKHTLILSDSTARHATISGDGKLLFRPPNEVSASDEHIYVWKHDVSLQPGSLVLRDFDYQKPNTDLEVRLNTDRKHSYSALEQYEYPGNYSEAEDGRKILKVRSDEFGTKAIQLQGQARSHRLETGLLFKLEEHPNSEENKDYLVISSTIDIVSGEIDQLNTEAENKFEVKFLAIPNTSTFRASRVTPKPVIAGPQTAIVTGKNGEEIWTDSLGRVKVQFPWDRLGKNDESSSCWIRVAQVWAGKGWGAVHIPRIGQEVIVEFLEGDADRPLITGRVYNADQTLPYPLPNHATQSGIKSRSSPEGDTETFNELRFEDKKGEELITFHAEKNFERNVENNDVIKVGFDKKDPGDQTIEVFNDQVVKIGCGEASSGNQTLEIWKDQTETIHTGNRSVTIEKGNDTLTVSQGDQQITISSGNQKIDISSGKCEITAGQKMVLTVGSSSIELTPSKIVIKSPQVEIVADGKAVLSGTMTEVKGSAVLKAEGGVVKIN